MNIFKKCIKKVEGKAKFIDDKELRQEMNLLVETINQNSNLPMPILITYNPEKIIQANKYIPNFMSNDYYYDDYTLTFCGYPTDEDENFLTDIELHNEKYDILGISINTNKKEAIQKLVEFGFSIATNKKTNFRNYSDDEDTLCFEKLDVKVVIQLYGDNVSQMLISINTYYLGNRLY